MEDSLNNKPPVWFWIISVIALLWNLMGVGAYLSKHLITEDMVAQLEPQLQYEMGIEHPAWYTSLFAIAVFSGILACFGLLLRKKWAYILFVISFLCATAQQIYYVMTVEGTDKVMPVLIVIAGLLFIWFSKLSTSKGWIK
jgi:hypothetical protein